MYACMQVLPYRNTGTFVIAGLDDIISLLDDHLAKTQTMRTSPFIKPIEGICKDWEFRLKYAQVNESFSQYVAICVEVYIVKLG